jgi:hypothetical protein
MQRNSVISVRVTPVAWRRLSSQAGADPHAAYGCVDWYLYQDAPGILAARPTGPAPLAEPTEPAQAQA